MDCEISKAWRSARPDLTVGLEAGYGLGHRAIRGMGYGKALPGYAGARRAPPGRGATSRGDDAHGALEAGSGLEQITEDSGLDLADLARA
jgi:hypothetical protein